MEYVIIDSGLNIEFINHQVVGGVTFQIINNTLEKKENEFNDENGHGSMVFQSIFQKSKSTDKFYIVKILNKNNRGNTQVLYQALKWLLYIDMKYIIICIATENSKYKVRYQEIINRLVNQGKIIISSWTNNLNSEIAYPAMLDNVISVGRSKLYSKNFEIDMTKKIQCLLNIDPSYIWIPNKGFQVFGGNSQATADFTSIVTNSIGNVKDIKDFKNKLCLVDFKKEKLKEKEEEFGSKVVLELYYNYCENKLINAPLWEVFSSVKELSDFLEDICTCLAIDKKKIIFRRSMFFNIQILSKEIEKFILKRKNLL